MKFAVIIIIVILSFFINLLYYTCWMLTDKWLMLESDEDLLTSISDSVKSLTSNNTATPATTTVQPQ